MKLVVIPNARIVESILWRETSVVLVVPEAVHNGWAPSLGDVQRILVDDFGGDILDGLRGWDIRNSETSTIGASHEKFTKQIVRFSGRDQCPTQVGRSQETGRVAHVRRVDPI